MRKMFLIVINLRLKTVFKYLCYREQLASSLCMLYEYELETCCVCVCVCGRKNDEAHHHVYTLINSHYNLSTMSTSDCSVHISEVVFFVSPWALPHVAAVHMPSASDNNCPSFCCFSSSLSPSSLLGYSVSIMYVSINAFNVSMSAENC